MREKLIQENSRITTRITDIKDMLADGVPACRAKALEQKLEMLRDVLFYNCEILDAIDN